MDQKPDVQYGVELPPHIHSGIHKNTLMIKVFFCMCLPAAAAVGAMGTGALFHILLAIATVLGLHIALVGVERLTGKPSLDPSLDSPLVAGMIVGLSMPIAAPYYATAVVAGGTMVVFKWLQGKLLGRKYLNPAAAAKLAVLLALTLAVGLRTGLLFHPHHLDLEFWTATGLSDALARMYADQPGLTPAQSLLLWKDHGWIGGASGVAVLVAGLAAVVWLKLKWRIVLSLLGMVAILAIFTGLLTGGSLLDRLAFHLFTGSVIFMGFFMATEPQSTPLTEGGQLAFGALLGLGTFLLQQMNVLGGSILVLIVLNLFTPLLDRIGMRRSYGHRRAA